MQDETPGLLDQVIAAYLQAEERGDEPSRHELLRKHPQLADELREFFSDRDRFRYVSRPERPVVPATVRYFGDYELLEEIARGGMGIVYKAKQTTLGRTVAVKMILAGHLASPDEVRRFRSEAESAAALQHPHIVAIHEVGTHHGRHYFSMDFVDGSSLAEMVRERPLPPRRAAAWVRQAAETMAYAHQQGILHRDLKPSNILIDATGRVRITDFGLAGRIEGSDSHTRTGHILGTPSYMSPEQAEGKRALIGPQSDVYSLGAVLYELLTGHPPFRAESVVETLHQVATAEPVSPRAVNPAVPRDLETICRKCLEKLPHERYLTAQLLANDLGRHLEGLPTTARPLGRLTRSWRWCRRNPAVAGMSAIVTLLWISVALTLGTYLPGWGGFSEGGADRSEADARLALRGLEMQSAFPDAPGTHTLVPVRRLQAHRDGFVRMALDPSGNLLATGSGKSGAGGITVWDLRTGRAVRDLPRQGEGIAALAFSPNSRLLASGGIDGEVRLWDLETGLLAQRIPRNGRRVCGLGFTADAQTIVVGFSGATGKNIRAWRVADGRLQHELEASALRSLTVAPAGDRIAVGHNFWTAQDRAAELATGPPEAELMRAFAAGSWFGVGATAFSASGMLLATGGEDQAVAIWDTTTGQRRQVLTGHSRRIEALGLVPQTELLVTAGASWTSDAPAEICVWDPHTGQLLASAEQPGGVAGIVVPQPDVVLSTDRRGTVTLWRLAEKQSPERDLTVPLGRPIDSSGERSDDCDEWFAALGLRSLAGSQRLLNPENGHVYQRIDHPGLTWREAKRLCESLGGHLATIGSAEENHFVYSNFASDHGVWLGGTDEQEEGQWRWVTEESFSYRNWGGNSPSDSQHDSEDYLMAGTRPFPQETDLGGSHSGAPWRAFAGDAATSLVPLCEWETESDVPPDLPVVAIRGADVIDRPVLNLQVSGGRFTACFGPDGSLIAAVDKNRIRVWRVPEGLESFSLQPDGDSLFDVCFSPNGKWIAAAGQGGVFVWDTMTQQKIAAPSSESMQFATRVAFTPDSSHLLAGRNSGLSVWRTDTWELHCEVPCERSWFSGVGLGPDGQWFAAAGQQPHVMIHDLNGEPMQRLTGSADLEPPDRRRAAFHTVAVSPGGEFLAASGPQSFVIWDSASGEVRFAFPHLSPHAAAFSPRGSLLAMANREHNVILRDASSGREVMRLHGHSDVVTSAAFSPDGLRLVTASQDGEIKVWNLVYDATAEAMQRVSEMDVGPYDWPQWGGSALRNNTPHGENIPAEWAVGRFDRKTGEFDSSGAKNIKWVAQLGSQTFGNPVVANGKLFVGTNNGAGYLPHYPQDIDLGVLLCFDETTGDFLWQHSSPKLPTGRVHDWPLQGICSTPVVDGNRLWFVSNRGEVICLDTDGFYDGKDEGPVRGESARVLDIQATSPDYPAAIRALGGGSLTKAILKQLAERGFLIEGKASIETVIQERQWKIGGTVGGAEREMVAIVAGPRLSFFKTVTPDDKDEADTIWRLDMIERLGVSPHNMSNCSMVSVDGVLYVCTSNGLDESHTKLPAPEAPSFIAVDRDTGEVLWTDHSPGSNILHAQWASPSYGVFAGQPQVIFPGGDGWVYSFDPRGDGHGNAKLLWNFDANPKESKWSLGGAGTRNNIIAFPVIYDRLVYIVMGQDPEHGEGPGRLWCIDPTKRGDVSAELVIDDQGNSVPHRRVQAADATRGERAIPNPNSAVVWQYSTQDRNGDGVIDFDEEFHRSISIPVIKDDILYAADYSGILHCLNAKTGHVYWAYDMLAACWGSPLLVDGKVYIGDEDGDVAIFRHSSDPSVAMRDGGPYHGEVHMDNSVYMTPIVANNTLYIATRSHLFAIGSP